jgi:hypothetical protein
LVASSLAEKHINTALDVPVPVYQVGAILVHFGEASPDERSQSLK